MIVFKLNCQRLHYLDGCAATKELFLLKSGTYFYQNTACIKKMKTIGEGNPIKNGEKCTFFQPSKPHYTITTFPHYTHLKCLYKIIKSQDVKKNQHKK